MPRGKMGTQPTAKSEQRRSMWGMIGSDYAPTVDEWDPNTADLFEAVWGIVTSGATVVFRPGSGGRSVGIAIWEGDDRHPPTWLYDTEEVDQWAGKVLRQMRPVQAEAAD